MRPPALREDDADVANLDLDLYVGVDVNADRL
jgi:hypothetical protein